MSGNLQEPGAACSWVEAWLRSCPQSHSEDSDTCRRPGEAAVEAAPQTAPSEETPERADVGESDRSDAVCPPAQPIGVFWDIENCAMPRRCSAGDFVALVRERFYAGCWEAEFMCACDVTKMYQPSLQQLNDAQVSVMHVPATSKNAADEKLKQALRRFSDQFPAPATVLLVTGDMNFAPDLAFLKHRKKHRVILIHNRQARPALLTCADERHLFDQLLSQLPGNSQAQEKRAQERLCCHLRLTGLPSGGVVRKTAVFLELDKLIDNCGGRVEELNMNAGEAIIAFPSPTNAARAKHRLHHAVVCGAQTFVQFHNKAGSQTADPGHTKGRPGQPAVTAAPVSTDTAAAMEQQRAAAAGGSADWRSSGGCSSGSSSGSSSSVSTQTSPVPGQRGHGPGSGRSAATQTSPSADGRLTGSSYDSCRSPTMNGSRPLVSSSDMSYNQRFSIQPSGAGSNGLPGSPGGMRSCPAGLVRPPGALPSGGGHEGPVELLVSNLDCSRPPREVERSLREMAARHAQVEAVTVYSQADGSLVGSITVRSLFESQVLVSEMHRAVLGSKRLQLAYARGSRQQPHVVRSQVVRLLSDVPSGRLPLVKFMELYEQRFHSTVSIADLYRMKEVISVQDTCSGRLIQLNPVLKLQQPSVAEPAAMVTCLRHPPQRGAAVGWAEVDDPSLLPNSDIALEELERLMQRLLSSHTGLVHLNSLLDCYAAECDDRSLSQLRLEPGAVCLEHLLSCLPDVRVVSRRQHKVLVWARDTPPEEPPPLHPVLLLKVQLFSREVVDLLRAAPRARMPFNRFIPAYHHHFGRQCRVSDYGFTRLADLFDVLPQIVQVLGCGQRRQITLTPRAQQRRFTSDLLRVLKNQPAKQMAVASLPAAFSEVTGREFSVWDYGATRLHWLLMAVNGESVVVYRQQGELRVAIPRREQTPEEMHKTRHFATEVQELLRHVPFCQMQFNKFIPAYHHHFGRQCRVSDYGFSKLAELLEAVPETACVSSDEDGEKVIQLTRSAMRAVLAQQVTLLMQGVRVETVSLEELCALFVREFGYRLTPSLYGALSMTDLMTELRSVVRLCGPPDQPRLTLVNRRHLRQVALQVRLLLMQQKSGALPLDKLLERYARRCHRSLPASVLTEDLQHVVRVEDSAAEGRLVRLLPLQLFSRDVMQLLQRHGGQLQLSGFHAAYLAHFGVPVRPAQFGLHSTTALLESLHDTVCLVGNGAQRAVQLLPELRSEGEAGREGEGTAPAPPPASRAAQEENSRGRVRTAGTTSLQVRGPPPPPLAWGAWVSWGSWSPPSSGPISLPPPSTLLPRPAAANINESGCLFLACPPAPSTLPLPQLSWLPPLLSPGGTPLQLLNPLPPPDGKEGAAVDGLTTQLSGVDVSGEGTGADEGTVKTTELTAETTPETKKTPPVTDRRQGRVRCRIAAQFPPAGVATN